MNYFELFPRTEYVGKECVDLTRRIVFRRTIAADPRAYAPYEVPAGQRTDQVADGYYGSSERDWLVLMSVDAIDPYFDWYMSYENFIAHVEAKYGTMENAVELVHHWQANWHGFDTELSPAQYASLNDPIKPYYEPVFGKGSDVLAYVRREEDLTVTTNMIVLVEVGEHEFQTGERVRARVSSGGVLEGQAEIAWANSSHLQLVHVRTGSDPGLYLEGVTSGEEKVIVSRTYVSNTIPVDERPYWEPVTMFDWEMDKNERKKNVRLIDSGYVQLVEKEMKKLLK